MNLAPTPKVDSLPPEGRKFPCKRCGAKLSFDPTSRALKCPYCGYVEPIAPQTQAIEERDFETYLEKQATNETTLDGRSTEVRCGGCGAVVLLEDKVVTDHCPFCAAPLHNAPHTAEAMIAPESLLPFAVSQRKGVEAFNRWIAGLWFAPNSLKQFANLGQLSGVYVPFWTFDSMTYTHYTGQRGDDYTETQTYTETNSQGIAETKTRQVTRTEWSSASGEVDHFFDDVLVCASHSLPSDMVATLEPWDLNSLTPFQPEFLSGFKTERYTVGLGDGFALAQQAVDVEIRKLCCRDIGGDHQQLATVNTQHVGVTFKHVLLPIWLAIYRYHDQTYRILVNARTGEISGSRPDSWAKITTVALAALATIATIAWYASTH